MAEFSVKSYDSLDIAKDIIKETSERLTEELEECNSKLQKLFDKETFYGPIAEHVANALNIINTATKNKLSPV